MNEAEDTLDIALRCAFAVGRAAAFLEAQEVVGRVPKAQALARLNRLAWEATRRSAGASEGAHE